MAENKEIRDAFIRHAIWLERYKTGAVESVIKALNRSDKEAMDVLAAGLSAIEARGYDIGPANERRLNALLEDIKAKRSSSIESAHEAIDADLKELAVYEASFTERVISAAYGSGLSLDMPPASQLHAAVTKKPFQGRLLRDWFSGLEESEGRRVSDAVRIGIIEGRTTDQIVRQIRGTRALNYSDGILDITRRDARTVVRTATAHVAARAKDDLYAANTEVLTQEQVVATLDMHTTPGCQALDGKVYATGAGPKFPRHMNCRTIRVPYLGESSVVGTRASASGPVPETMNYEQWLKSQPANVQDEVLGKARAKMFREGNLPLDRFVDGQGNSYTLQQMAQRDAGVFDSVFGGGVTRNPALRRAHEAEFKSYLGEKTYARMSDGVTKAMKASGVASYGLSQAEKVAVHAYTTGDKYYERLNAAMRSGSAERIAAVAPMANVLDNALAKLPIYEGPVLFRVTDLPEAVAKKVRAGNVYADPAFMSASKTDMGTTFGNDYRFTIVASQKGREIAGFSAYSHEQEVIFPRGTKFDITEARKDTKTGFTEVTLYDAE
jgi:SPP1 gp7 family putative phage head morphogenesis protein